MNDTVSELERVEHDLFLSIKNSNAYKLIADFYGDKTAKRSGVKLINHIDEGIKILIRLCASSETMEAYCLHPIFQDDINYLYIKNQDIKNIEYESIILAIEYRYAANSFLSTMIRSDYKPSIFPHVKQMLIADKIQNRKDFELYHKDTHPRSNELSYYFDEWMDILGISEGKYNEIIQYVKNEFNKQNKCI